MNGRLYEKTAIVTGAARGIGACITERFCEEGASVLATDVLDAEGEKLCASLRARGLVAEYAHVDVASERDWEAACARCVTSFGHIDTLVNNAGLLATTPLAEETLEGWQRVIDVDLTGVFLGMRAVIPLMREREQGAIINLSSCWCVVGAPGSAAYHASKGGVTALTKNAAVTYAGDGIRANSLHPGGIDTVMFRDGGGEPWVLSRTPMGRIGKVEEIAGGAVFLASDEAAYMTGAELVIDGGYLAS